MARSGAEANRLVKQGAVWIGGCIAPCNKREFPFVCTCNGWHKSTNPIEDVPSGQVIRIGNGMGENRLLVAEGRVGFDQLMGIGRIPIELETVIIPNNLKIHIPKWRIFKLIFNILSNKIENFNGSIVDYKYSNQEMKYVITLNNGKTIILTENEFEI